jgi:hypothetical protein
LHVDVHSTHIQVAGEKPNTSLLVQRIVELMSEAPPPAGHTSHVAHTSHGSSSKKALTASSSSGAGAMTVKHSRELKKQHEDLQRRYR